ncbi:hypothetical protein JCM10207_000119 [Rhodosporidiobolus poonsookiae]
MSDSYGTPVPTRTASSSRPTQPPLGPSLSTPHRSPYPTSLRPSLFQPRPSPLAGVALSPATALATRVEATAMYATPKAVVAAGRLRAPQNTPASAYSARSVVYSDAAASPRSASTLFAGKRNPFEALPASAFDSFVSSLTTSIRSALTPADTETPSQRRKREREERAHEREEAQRERERAQQEREERDRLEQEKERELMEQDVFGEIRAVAALQDGEEEARENGGPYEGRESSAEQLHAEDFAEHGLLVRHAPSAAGSTTYDPLPCDVSLRSTPANYSSPRTHSRTPSAADPEEIALSSSPVPAPADSPRKSLFISPAPGSDAGSDGSLPVERLPVNGDVSLREESYGLDTAEEPSSEVDGSREDETSVDERESVQDDVSYVSAADMDDYVAPAEDEQEEIDHVFERQEDAYVDPSTYADPFGRPTRYRMGSEEEYEEEGVEQPPMQFEEREEREWGSEVDEAEQEWAGRGAQDGAEEQEEDEGEEEDEKSQATGEAETIDLVSSSDEEEADVDEEEDGSVNEGSAEQGRSVSGTPEAAESSTSPRLPLRASYAPLAEETDTSDRQLDQHLSATAPVHIEVEQADAEIISSRSPSPVPPHSQDDPELDEAALVAEAHRHNALPRDTPDAPDRMVGEMQGTYPPFAGEEYVEQEEEGEVQDDEEERERAMVREAHRHNALPRDTPDAPDRMVEVVEGTYPSSSPAPAEPLAPEEGGVEEGEVQGEDDLERAMVREAHRHNALPRDTPDAPDRMVEVVEGTYPAPGGAEAGEEVEMLDIADSSVEEPEFGMERASSPSIVGEGEGEGEYDSAAMGDIESMAATPALESDRQLGGAVGAVSEEQARSEQELRARLLAMRAKRPAPDPPAEAAPAPQAAPAAVELPPLDEMADEVAAQEMSVGEEADDEGEASFPAPEAAGQVEAAEEGALEVNPLEELYADEDSEVCPPLHSALCPC